MECNNFLDHVAIATTENLLNTLRDFPDFPMQGSQNNPLPYAVSTTSNRHLRPENEPFYADDGWLRSCALRENVRTVHSPVGNMQENNHLPSLAAWPAARNHPLQPDVFYSDDIRHLNLEPRDAFAVNSIIHRQASWDPFCPGGESFWDSGSKKYASVNPSIPDDFSLEDEFARLKFLDDHQHQCLPEWPSAYGVAGLEVRNSSSLNCLRGNEVQQQFSNGNLQVLRARAAAEAFNTYQAYSAFNDSFLIPDSYWGKRDFNGFKNTFGDTDGISINGFKPRNGFDFSAHRRLSIDSNNSASSMPLPPCNGHTLGSAQRATYSSLEDLKGRVFLEAMDRDGCEFLGRKLDERKPEDIQMIFSEVKDHIHTLMYDRFGNDVVQKLFEVCNEEQMSQLVFSVTADDHLLMAVCLDPQGCQSMQKFVECLMAPEQISLMISTFRRITVPLVNNQIGSRVIQHALSVFPAQETEIILDVIADNCFQIATNRSGCCFLQVFITKDCPLESQRRIVTEIVLNIHQLSKNQFGNYVVQHVIGLEIPTVIKSMVAGLRGNFVSLSTDKYGSHVVEKLMKAWQEKYAPQIINEIISSPSFLNVVLDPCGNYVIQSAKKYATVVTTSENYICSSLFVSVRS
ncbi:pumilio12-like [Dorcoceras hygrometricum]|uniref:Pumilio12-like n=1 Tax=Dorcoceras hygrometricum TaxID=472368 RepID=A0A2Z7CIG1_9LAMI|nr:pumilio12-like [Dorcoceras hygrometricum]